MSTPPPHPPLVIYVDVDDTLIRTVGTKRIPISDVVDHVHALFHEGAELYCWSTGGADYARAVTEELGIANCFRAFLPKPHVLLDDQPFTDWRRLITIHPLQCRDATITSYRASLTPE